MGILSIANMFGSFALGYLSDKFGRKRVIALSAFPAAVAAFIVFSWLESPVWLALDCDIWHPQSFRASVGCRAGAGSGAAGQRRQRRRIIMSLHYTAGVVAPLIAAHILGATGDIVLAMILATSVPLILYGCLIGAVRERQR